jgi:tetratricopeptide (TPR) repeat protein
VNFEPVNAYVNRRFCAVFLISFLSGILITGSNSFSNEIKAKDFQRQYRQYQGQVRAGKAAINKKEYLKAIDHYSKAIEISPFVASHYYYRGLAWYRKGNKDKAIEDFDRVIILDSGWSSAYIYRGLCRMKGGEYKKALSDYQRALKMNPKDSGVHNNLACLYATAKDEKFQNKGKALEHSKKAAELSKERNAEILDTLARAYFINGKVKEALETESKALKLAPNNEGFKENLKIYQKAMKD